MVSIWEAALDVSKGGAYKDDESFSSSCATTVGGVSSERFRGDGGNNRFKFR